MKKQLLVGAICGGLLSTALLAPGIQTSVRNRLVQVNTLHPTSMASANNDEFFQVILDLIVKFVINGALNGSTQGQVAVGEKVQYALQQSLQGKFNYKAATQTTEDVANTQTDFQPANQLRACRVMEDSTLAQNAGLNADLDSKASSMVMAQENINPTAVGMENERTGALVQEVTEKYCSQDNLTTGRCTTLSSMPDAHIQVSTLYNLPEEYAPSTYSKEQYEAAKAFIKIVTDPVVKGDIPLALEKTEAGKTYRLKRMVNAAYMSVAQQGLNRLAASRAPATDANTTN